MLTLPLRPNSSRLVEQALAALPPAWRTFAFHHNHVVREEARDAVDRRKAAMGLQIVQGSADAPAPPVDARVEALADGIMTKLYGKRGPREIPPEVAHLVEAVDLDLAVMSRGMFLTMLESIKTIPDGLLLKLTGPYNRDNIGVVVEEAKAPTGVSSTTVKVRSLTEHGWGDVETAGLSLPSLQGNRKGIGWNAVVGLDDPVKFLAGWQHSVQSRDQHDREMAAAEGARLTALAAKAPYIATVLREEGVSRSDDTMEARILRAFFKRLGLPLTVRVRRYSMASGMDLRYTGPTLPDHDEAGIEQIATTIDDVLPGVVRVGRHESGYRLVIQHGLYIREQENKSDPHTDYFDPGGDRVAQAYAPILRQVAQKTLRAVTKRQPKAKHASVERRVARDGDLFLDWNKSRWTLRRVGDRYKSLVGSDTFRRQRTIFKYDNDGKTIDHIDDAKWATFSRIVGKYDADLRFVGANSQDKFKAMLQQFGLWRPDLNVFIRPVSAGTEGYALTL